MPSLFERLGGDAALRAISDEFVDAMVSDLMIGFLFADVDRAHLKEMEFAFSANFLGADIPYRGRPLRAAHARHAIQGGHFDRRTQILRTVLSRHGVPEDVRRAWLAHVESLREQITAHGAGSCA